MTFRFRDFWLDPWPLVVAGALLVPSLARSAPPAERAAAVAVVEAPLKLPADIVYSKVAGDDSAVVFSHQTHVAYENNRCVRCHPQPFKLLAPTHRVRHGDMNAGRSCGICHNGREGAAFAVRDPASCSTCHSGRHERQNVLASGGTAPTDSGSRRLPKPWVFQGAADSPGKVTFRHETHLSAQTSCTRCHPKPFAMRPPRAALGMAAHEQCGGCHDGARSFGVEDADACRRCHVEAGGAR
jgi:c(7)-type cytochrome triheme protein